MLGLIFQQQRLDTKLLFINFGDISASILKIFTYFQNILNEILHHHNHKDLLRHQL
jgi:hypothetical protein